jgi:hypothetical protein
VSQGLRHALAIALVCIVYEAQFLYAPPNPVDEGWPLYAAQRLHEGGTLYADTFFVFPPGHLLSAWLGYAVAPPGLEAARVLYGAFNLALCLALYAFGRRILPAHLALLAALLVGVATYRSHAHHNVFGYRYLIWSVLALLAFARRCEGGNRLWLLAAGALAGVATGFRLTPGFAVSVAIGLTTFALPGGIARWLRDWLAYAAGLALALLPVIAWAATGVDLATLWREVVVRPLVMTDLQQLSIPSLWPMDADSEASGRELWTRGFVALQYYLYPLLLLGHGIALAAVGLRARRAGTPFAQVGQPLLLCTWWFALVYFARTLGRSDEAHLVSALPPLCLLAVHALGAALPRLRAPAPGGGRAAALVAVFALWSLGWGSDRAFAPIWRDLSGNVGSGQASWLGQRAELRASQRAARERIQRGEPRRMLLDLSSRPLIYTTGEFRGPGWLDVVMPGTFMSEQEERAFVARLQAAPPDGVFWPSEPFDRMPERGAAHTAPILSAWARERYGPPPP